MPILVTNVRTLPSNDFSSSGMPFSLQSPHPSFALIGVTLRAGSWIDQVSPIFAELLEDGTLGPEIQGPSAGGWGGAPEELRVTPGYVITGIQTRSGSFVDAVRFLQARWNGTALDPAAQRWTPWAGSPQRGGVERVERMVEPIGAAVAVGIAGRAGDYVDNLTLIGAELMRVGGTAMAGVSSRGSSRATIAAG